MARSMGLLHRRVRLNARSQMEWSAPVKLHPHVKRELPGYFASSFDFVGACKNCHGAQIEPLPPPFGNGRGCVSCGNPWTRRFLHSSAAPTNRSSRSDRSATFWPSASVRDYSMIPSPYRAGLPFTPLPRATWEPAKPATAPAISNRPRHSSKLVQITSSKLPTSPTLKQNRDSCSCPESAKKIADCVLLFGAGKYEAFPVDVWITKCMNRLYSLDGWNPRQIAHFGRTRFGPYAGLAQQFLFAGERNRRLD